MDICDWIGTSLIQDFSSEQEIRDYFNRGACEKRWPDNTIDERERVEAMEHCLNEWRANQIAARTPPHWYTRDDDAPAAPVCEYCHGTIAHEQRLDPQSWADWVDLGLSGDADGHDWVCVVCGEIGGTVNERTNR